MEAFKVAAVIDGNTFEVTPKWEYEGQKGTMVHAKGYIAPRHGKEAMKLEQNISILILNKKVELGMPDGIEGDKLVCEVYFEGRNIADYFAQYKDQQEEEQQEEEQYLEEEEDDEDEDSSANE
jgi:TATA-binding protein-associated factor Taf7